MKNIDDVLDAVQKSDWSSDYKIGRGLGYNNSTQVSNWRRRQSMPNYEDLISMCDHAGLNLEEAVRAVAYSKANERPLKQTGFADIQTLVAISGMSLAGVTMMSNHPVLIGSISSILGGIYIMRS